MERVMCRRNIFGLLKVRKKSNNPQFVLKVYKARKMLILIFSRVSILSNLLLAQGINSRKGQTLDFIALKNNNPGNTTRVFT